MAILMLINLPVTTTTKPPTMTKTYQINLVLAKLTQNKYWVNPLRKCKSRVSKMSDDDFLYYTNLVNELKNGSK